MWRDQKEEEKHRGLFSVIQMNEKEAEISLLRVINEEKDIEIKRLLAEIGIKY